MGWTCSRAMPAGHSELHSLIVLLYIINDTEVRVDEKASSASQGGTSSYVAGIINHLLEKGKAFGLIGNFSVSTRLNCPVHAIHPTGNAGFLQELFTFFARQSFQSDDILYFQRPDHAFCAFFSKGKKIIHLHGQQRTTIRYRRSLIHRFIYNLLESLAMRFSSKVIATDQVTAHLYLQLYPFLKNRLTVIPTGIDTEFFSPVDSNNITRDLTTLLYIGRLGYPKRVDQVIRGFELALKIRPELNLVITGDGQDKDRLQDLVSGLKLSDKVTFTGVIGRRDILELIRRSFAGILLSFNEGSPISLKECLACGIPVIANDVGDVREYIIQGKTGILVDADSDTEISEAILSLSNVSESYKEQCLEIAAQYSQEALYKKTIQFLSEESSQ